MVVGVVRCGRGRSTGMRGISSSCHCWLVSVRLVTVVKTAVVVVDIAVVMEGWEDKWN